MSKNLDETVCLQSEKREEWIREIREERLQGIAEGKSSAPREKRVTGHPLQPDKTGGEKTVPARD